MRIRRILDTVWRWLSAERRLTEIFIVLVVVQCVIFILPQAPVPPGNSPAYLRWLAELRPDLKGWTNLLAALGFLTLRTSLWIRGILICLALLFAVRIGVLRETWATFSHGQRARGLLFCAGSLLVIMGWGMQTLWGWKQHQVIAWPETSVVVPDRGLTLPPQDRRWNLWAGRYGLYLLPKGDSIGVTVQATDQQGAVLALLPSARSDPQQQLRLALTTESPEAYFALSEVDLVFRISQLQGEKSIQAQVYRSASGELLAETTLEGDGTLFTDDIRLKLDLDVLPRYEAVYNPGAWIEGAGMLMLAVVVGWCIVRKTQDATAASNTTND